MSAPTELHTDNINRNDFTSKENERISSLKDKISSRGSSVMEKQIAQAELDDLIRSKEPAPHNHKHSIQGLPDQSVRGNSNIYHDDEAFEKYEMGQERPNEHVDKSVNQDGGSMTSVKNNHKARGSLKERTDNTFDHLVYSERSKE